MIYLIGAVVIFLVVIIVLGLALCSAAAKGDY